MILIDSSKNMRFIRANDMKQKPMEMILQYQEPIKLILIFYDSYINKKMIPNKFLLDVSDIVQSIKYSDHLLVITLSGKSFDVFACASALIDSLEGIVDYYVNSDAQMLNAFKLGKTFDNDASILIQYLAKKSLSDYYTVFNTIARVSKDSNKRQELFAFLEKIFKKIYGVDYRDVLGKKLDSIAIKPDVLNELKES